MALFWRAPCVGNAQIMVSDLTHSSWEQGLDIGTYGAGVSVTRKCCPVRLYTDGDLRD